MKRFAFVGLYSDPNFGDPILARCTEKLYQDNPFEEIEIKRIDINKGVEKYSLLDRAILKLAHLLKKNEKYSQILGYKAEVREMTSFYYPQFEDCAAVIFAGGGLIKFRHQFFGAKIEAICRIAERLNIPVIFNSVGVEGFSENEWRCEALKRILHRMSVKAISTRDDIDTLIEGYFDGKPFIPCYKVSDAALWASDVYSVIKKKTGIIGLNVCRDTIFQNYGKDFSPEQLLSLYTLLIEKLSLNHNVLIFTNGFQEDNAIAKLLFGKYNKLNKNVALSIPSTPSELVVTISKCRAIVATRLHACIVSYSLDIPFVGLVWNDKLLYFGESIGYSHRMIKVDDLNTECIIKTLDDALNTGYDQSVKDVLKYSIKENINNICKEIFGKQ